MTTTQQMKFRYVELFLLFVVLPFFLAIPIPLSVRLGVVALGLVYVVILFLKHKLIVFQFSSDVDWGSFAKYTMLRNTVNVTGETLMPNKDFPSLMLEK